MSSVRSSSPWPPSIRSRPGSRTPNPSEFYSPDAEQPSVWDPDFKTSPLTQSSNLAFRQNKHARNRNNHDGNWDAPIDPGIWSGRKEYATSSNPWPSHLRLPSDATSKYTNQPFTMNVRSQTFPQSTTSTSFATQDRDNNRSNWSAPNHPSDGNGRRQELIHPSETSSWASLPDNATRSQWPSSITSPSGSRTPHSSYPPLRPSDQEYTTTWDPEPTEPGTTKITRFPTRHYPPSYYSTRDTYGSEVDYANSPSYSPTPLNLRHDPPSIPFATRPYKDTNTDSTTPIPSYSTYATSSAASNPGLTHTPRLNRPYAKGDDDETESKSQRRTISLWNKMYKGRDGKLDGDEISEDLIVLRRENEGARERKKRVEAWRRDVGRR